MSVRSVLAMPVLATANIGGNSNYAGFAADGSLTFVGDATVFDDLRVEGATARVGAVAPTDGTGFRGDANHQMRTFVHTQADEVQFYVQFMHGLKVGSTCYPHVHFMPVTTGTGVVKFVLEYYWANVNGQFPGTPGTYPMTYAIGANKQWYHLIADGAGLTLANVGLSAIMKCRLYRDNTVGSNLAAAVAFLYFDIHVELNSLGSSQEYIK